MQGVIRDLRHAIRQLRQAPVFALTAVVTLSLGIGANTTIFSWMNSTLFSPVPGANPPGTLIVVRRGQDSFISYPDYVDLRNQTRSLSGLAAFDTHAVNLTRNGKPLRLWAVLATANYFNVLGVRPLKGRFFLADEDKAPGRAPVAILSYRTWQLLFQGDPAIVGRTIYLNQHPYTVIGVAPALFQGAQPGLRADLWASIMQHNQLESTSDNIHDRGSEWLSVLGVLKAGVSREAAQRELSLEMQQLARAYPKEHQGRNDMVAFPMWRAPDSGNEYLSVMLPPLMAIALLVLLLACTNVANLFLVRSIARRREIAVRLSLGATRSRLVQQLLAESILIALASGAIALFITRWTARSFERFIPQTDLPIVLNIHVDGRVLAVAFLISALTGIAFGLLPALRASSIVPVPVLKEEGGSASPGRHKGRLISALVVGQIALSFLLLVCGGLFFRGLRNAQHADPGFNPNGVLLAQLDLFSAGYDQERGLAFERELLRRLDQIPGVQSASFADWSLLGFIESDANVLPEGYAPQLNESLALPLARVGPDYLKTMQIPLVAGRDFAPNDDGHAERVATVNQTFVDRYWHGKNAIGRRLRVYGDWYTVVGVMRNAKYSELEEAPAPFVCLPAAQDYILHPVLHVRVTGDPRAYIPPVEQAVHSLNADLPVYDEYPLARNMQIASIGTRVAGVFVGMFGIVGLTLAAIGIYGVIAYSTRQRLHEIGIRMALGARRGNVLRLILRQGLQLTGIGMSAGLVAALLLTPLLHNMLYGVAPSDLLTYCGVTLLLFCVTLAACFLPAFRAANIEPIRVLRSE